MYIAIYVCTCTYVDMYDCADFADTLLGSLAMAEYS